jgi:hypothetical protein
MSGREYLSGLQSLFVGIGDEQALQAEPNAWFAKVAATDRRNMMKTFILAAIAALSLGVGSAFAMSVQPPGTTAQHNAPAFSNFQGAVGGGS